MAKKPAKNSPELRAEVVKAVIDSFDEGVPESSLPDPNWRCSSATCKPSACTTARNSAFSASRAANTSRNRALARRSCSTSSTGGTSDTSHDHHHSRRRIKHPHPACRPARCPQLTTRRSHPTREWTLNHVLLDGLPDAWTSRVSVFRRSGVVVHAKTVIVDDEWASIGSCNMGQRSLYTDVEHGIGFTDPEGHLVRDYRVRLWAHHLGTADPAELIDLPTAFHAWQSRSESVETVPRQPPVALPSVLPPVLPPVHRLTLPLAEVPYTARHQRTYEGIHDPDSRETWGGLLPPGLL